MEKKPESIFINRELSWLDFDSRVLALAKEKTVPLGERIKFAAIFGSNMDEFFMVRVGSLYDQTLLKNNKTDNVTHMTAAEQIAAITPRVAELQAKCDKYFQHLVSALAQEGYKKVDFAKLAKPQEHFWKTYFQRELLPLLSPQIVDSRHPFPFLNNKDIYYIAQLHSKNEGISYGIVPVSSQFERVLFVKDGETTCFAFVEELIAHYAATIFSASIFGKETIQEKCLFRVTRNADIDVKLVQIGAVDRKKFDPLCKRNIFILSQRKNAPVEIQPAQFPVDKNGIVTHNHSPFCCAGPPAAAQLTVAIPAQESTMVCVRPGTLAASSTRSNGPFCVR